MQRRRDISNMREILDEPRLRSRAPPKWWDDEHRPDAGKTPPPYDFHARAEPVDQQRERQERQRRALRPSTHRASVPPLPRQAATIRAATLSRRRSRCRRRAPRARCETSGAWRSAMSRRPAPPMLPQAPPTGSTSCRPAGFRCARPLPRRRSTQSAPARAPAIASAHHRLTREREAGTGDGDGRGTVAPHASSAGRAAASARPRAIRPPDRDWRPTPPPGRPDRSLLPDRG